MAMEANETEKEKGWEYGQSSPSSFGNVPSTYHTEGLDDKWLFFIAGLTLIGRELADAQVVKIIAIHIEEGIKRCLSTGL